MRRLLAWRRTAPAVHDGKLTQYVPQDGVYVYFRHTDAQKVMVILNNNDASRTLDTQALSRGDRRGADGDGRAVGRAAALAKGVVVPAHSAAILELH